MIQQTGVLKAKVDEADQLRANLYGLLARLLRAPADSELLSMLRSLGTDDSELGQAIGALAEAARNATPETIREEYETLFIGMGRGLLVPFGSYYLTGFLNEKPLARLRADMEPLGIVRSPDVKEPEDHVAALMEVMAGLIEGRFGAAHPLPVQRGFFARHVLSWTPHFFADLEKAPAARFYSPVGRIGRLFMSIEEVAFEM